MMDSDIAIVGMAGRFPGARTVDEFWRGLLAGTESIRMLDRASRPGFVPAVATMDGVDRFDAAFFGVSPALAEIMDPQHRVFMEVAWEALEDVGYDPTRYAARIGVYAGATANTYFVMNLASDPDIFNRFTPIELNTANANDFLTTRFSYVAGLTGPSHAVQCACSTSLVAVCVACQALLDGQCEMALAGGVSVNVTHLDGYRHVDGGMVSPDGHCRAFSASAAGTVFGNGAGVVVLKPLAAALRDHDRVQAVIIGSAINNDGRNKVGYLAPGVEGQAQAIAEALANSGVPAESIGYVEAHGTGTPLGDPIEIRALTKAFRASTSRSQFCGVGSVKSNVGHLDAAAGVTGLIKATLAVSNGIVPKTLHAESPNPEIDFPHTPFFVDGVTRPWTAQGPRRAGVSAFGVGGTNAHVVIEQAPPQPASVDDGRWRLLPLSARSMAALQATSNRLADWLRTHDDLTLGDVAFTLQMGRRRFRFRRGVICRTIDEAVSLLARPLDVVEARHEDARPVAFVFGDSNRRESSADAEAQWSSFAAQFRRARRLMELGLSPAAVHADGRWQLMHRALNGLTTLDTVRRWWSEAATLGDSSSSRDTALAWAAASDGMLVWFGGEPPASVDGVSIGEIEVDEGSASAEWLRLVARLWAGGADIDCACQFGNEARTRVSLPTYPFEHERYWIERRTTSSSVPRTEPIAGSLVARPPLAVSYVAPETPIEQRIAQVWSTSLGVRDIGVDDNFFDLGGDSLRAVQVARELTGTLGVSMPAASLYEGVTIRRLAASLDDAPTIGGAERREAGVLRRRAHYRRQLVRQPASAAESD
jgi:acyl transferase domain-containing protein